jgi:hypothetical protein
MSTPLLVIDVYHANFGDKEHGVSARWSTLWNAQNRASGFVGAYLKCGDGTKPHSWFRTEWPKVRAAAGDRFGVDAFRGSYWFLRAKEDPIAQADAYVSNLTAAGGMEKADMHPMVDVERGRAGGGNDLATKDEWIDCTSKFVARVKQLTGRPVISYGRTVYGDHQIKTDMGCALAWDPSYTARQHDMPDPPWPRDRVVLWQYTGDPNTNHTSFPDQASGFGKTDVSVFLGRTEGGAEMYNLDVFRGLLTGLGGAAMPGAGGGVLAGAAAVGLAIVTLL